MRPGAGLIVGLAVLLAATAAGAQVVSVTTDRVNLRAEPSTASRVIQTLGKGAMVEIQERVGEWYRVKTLAAGVEGYLHQSIVSAPGVKVPVPPTPQGVPRQPAGPPQVPPPAGPPAARPSASDPAAPSAQSAQPRLPAPPPLVRRAVIWLNGAYQATSIDFADTATFDLHAEQGSFTADYTVPGGLVIDAGLAIRVWRDLLLGGGVSRFSVNRPAAVSARLPHPFYFDRYREVSGQSAGITRSDLIVSAVVMWMVPAGDRVQVGIFGGPSYFSVRQPLVKDVEFDEQYPYDEATFTGALVSAQTQTALGVTAGADVTFLLTDRLGVGGLVRFSRASLELTTTGARTLTLTAGGLQVGGGLRLRF